MIVLVIVDDTDHSTLLAQLIRLECKFEVVTAYSVLGALALLHSNSNFLAIVSDFELRDGTVHNVFEALQTKSKNIPLLIYSNAKVDPTAFASGKFLGVVSKDKPKEVCSQLLKLANS